jgi:ectoine hydroxylase-related dioxygenase (phytanoyl-CoA dioxygenase family)
MEAQKYDPTLPNIELNQSQKDQFKEKGYLILKDVINEDFITEL